MAKNTETTETTNEVTPIVERWLYVGFADGETVRTLNKFVMLDADGNETGKDRCYKADKKTYVVGGIYDVQVWHEPDGIKAGVSKAVFVKRLPDGDKLRRLVLAHELFKQTVKNEQIETRLKKFQFPETLDEMRQAYQRLRTYNERKVFEQLLIQQISKI